MYCLSHSESACVTTGAYTQELLELLATQMCAKGFSWSKGFPIYFRLGSDLNSYSHHYTSRATASTEVTSSLWSYLIIFLLYYLSNMQTDHAGALPIWQINIWSRPSLQHVKTNPNNLSLIMGQLSTPSTHCLLKRMSRVSEIDMVHQHTAYSTVAGKANWNIFFSFCTSSHLIFRKDKFTLQESWI